MDSADYHAAERQHVSDPSVYADVTDQIGKLKESTCCELKRLVSMFQCELGSSV